MDNTSLGEHFFEYFNIFVANTQELKEQVFRIRYQVYCQELGYEPLENFPDSMERDAYDNRSIHCILQHKSTGIYAGCVRLVLSNTSDINDRFPFESVCPNHSLDFRKIPRTKIGEVSRLAVISRFRKRAGEQNTPDGLIVFNNRNKEEIREQRRRSSVIALGLYLAATGLVIDLSLSHGVTLMEPRLARHLRMSGLIAHPIGSLVDFHGKRGPYIMDKDEIVSAFGSNVEVYHLYQKILNTLKKGFSYHSCIA
ncbi:PEP-CTERM/exosortase system-associated acyltransferase [Cyanobacterium stanieri LEGE 03274]|uniref:PEP-CTERM/exosortase system-associated acyltransferase n=1 Tax=Cyanobacterium stanieri LEGE 03274 TaxID=1828756 RepID=A0ABR9V491_9CHRO|nr:PEP-CTERM/exosortase system-associated acyltransferase [Cyanobacterium stanieri]MBE9222719.1 PEP-CTERM/exosortase system-associated acyltransferase [Cyanobacterium stanieri LEGE 03274]